jgi:hypothetical protein
MNTQTKPYRPLAMGLAVTLGVVAGILIPSFRFKLPKLIKGG